MNPARFSIAAALAVLTASASAQFAARPAAKVEFRYVRGDPQRPNYYELSGVAPEAVARKIEARLFPRTFLRAATELDANPYVLRVGLEERDAGVETATFIQAYLVFELAGDPRRFSDKRPLPAGLSFELRLCEKRGDNSAPAFLRDLDAALRPLASNPVDLIDGLLCYVPVLVRDADAPRDAYYFQADRFDEAKGDFERVSCMGLPLQQGELGLAPRSKFLVEVDVTVNQGRTTLFHLVASTPDRATDLMPTLPDYLKGGIAVVGVARAETATPTEAAAATAPQPAPVARFVPQIPLAAPRAPLDLHNKLDPAPHAVETRRIYVAECVPIDAASADTRPSDKVGDRVASSGAPQP